MNRLVLEVPKEEVSISKLATVRSDGLDGLIPIAADPLPITFSLWKLYFNA